MANEIIDLQNEFVYKGQRYRLPGSGGGSSEPGQPGADGITPHIDVVTGHWFIGDEDTGIPARGLQGNSGYTGAVGELEVVEDYTEGGVGKAASAESVKEMAIKSIPDAGTFAEAYEKARANNVVFPWFLRDVDENGNPIEKMIWHNGYRKFVDAIGAEVEGQRNGLTIKVNADCELRLGYDSSNNPIGPNTTSEKIVQLSKGVNNFTFNELNWNGTDIVKYFEIREIRQNESDTPVSHPDYVEEIDFGWMKIQPNYTSFGSWHQLKKVKRLEVKYTSWNAGLLSDCPELTDVQVRGIAVTAYQYNIMRNSKKVEKADFSGLIMNFSEGTTSGLYNSFGCNDVYKPSALKYLDIRGIDTRNSARLDGFAQYATTLKTFIIGYFSNGAITDISKQASVLLDVTDCVLICTTSTPPVLKNCTFTDGNPNDEHSADWDWLDYVDSGVTKCRFSAIYVPSDAVTAYKSNVYVTGGVEGNTGWSRWADLIHDIAGTEYEDLI